MKPFKLLHTGDLHLDSPMTTLGDSADLRRHELLQTFSNIVDIAARQQVDALVIAGDLFDSAHITPSTARLVAEKLEQLENVAVFVALGNHDFGCRNVFPSNVHVFSNRLEAVKLPGATIYGASFSQEYCDQSIVEQLVVDDSEARNILVLHADLVGTGQTSRYNAVTAAALGNTGMDYVALGHVHRFDGVHKINGTSYAYCGTPEGRGFDETGDKGVLLVDVEKRHVSAQFLPVCKRRCMVLEPDVSQCKDYHEIYEKVKTLGLCPDDLYKIVLSGATNADVQLPLLTKLLQQDCFYLKLLDRTVPDVDIDELAKEHTLTGLFARHMLEQGASKRALAFGLRALAGGKVNIDED